MADCSGNGSLMDPKSKLSSLTDCWMLFFGAGIGFAAVAESPWALTTRSAWSLSFAVRSQHFLRFGGGCCFSNICRGSPALTKLSLG